MIQTQQRFVVEQIGNLPLIIYKGKKGYIATNYIDKNNAEKVGDVAAFVPGVKSVDEFKRTKIVAVTKWAEDIGLKEGMTVSRVIRILDGEEI